ncbi:MAG: AraC family transcriptional regulator [Clostridiales bacterium]|nr:AraC family transcriptional regulator [Clostridiales bacterium]
MASMYSKYNFGMFNPTNTLKCIHIMDIGYHDHSVVKAYTDKPRKSFYSSFHIILDGEGTLDFGNKVYPLSKGSVFYLPPYEPFLYLPSANNPYKFVWIGFDGDEINALLQKKGINQNNPILNIKNTKKMLTLVDDFIEHNSQKNVTEEKMLSFFFSFIHCVQSPKNTTKTAHASNNVEAIKRLISQNYMHHNFTIQSIASIMHVSHSWLCATFKRETGTSMHEYLISVRLGHSAELLTKSNLSINEISYTCGFNDALYFSAAFKKSYNVSPQNYRKAYKRDN